MTLKTAVFLVLAWTCRLNWPYSFAILSTTTSSGSRLVIWCRNLCWVGTPLLNENSVLCACKRSCNDSHTNETRHAIEDDAVELFMVLSIKRFSCVNYLPTWWVPVDSLREKMRILVVVTLCSFLSWSCASMWCPSVFPLGAKFWGLPRRLCRSRDFPCRITNAVTFPNLRSHISLLHNSRTVIVHPQPSATAPIPACF